MDSPLLFCGICFEDMLRTEACSICERFRICEQCLKEYSKVDPRCPQCRDERGFKSFFAPPAPRGIILNRIYNSIVQDEIEALRLETNELIIAHTGGSRLESAPILEAIEQALIRPRLDPGSMLEAIQLRQRQQAFEDVD